MFRQQEEVYTVLTLLYTAVSLPISCCSSLFLTLRLLVLLVLKVSGVFALGMSLLTAFHTYLILVAKQSTFEWIMERRNKMSGFRYVFTPFSTILIITYSILHSARHLAAPVKKKA